MPRHHPRVVATTTIITRIATEATTENRNRNGIAGSATDGIIRTILDVPGVEDISIIRTTVKTTKELEEGEE